MQLFLFDEIEELPEHEGDLAKPRKQLLKWIGNKQRFAHEIVSYFPAEYGIYYEPFLGSGAVLGTLAPERAIGSDLFKPLIEIWQTLRQEPETLKRWYAERWQMMTNGDKVNAYEKVKAAYNAHWNSDISRRDCGTSEKVVG